MDIVDALPAQNAIVPLACIPPPLANQAQPQYGEHRGLLRFHKRHREGLETSAHVGGLAHESEVGNVQHWLSSQTRMTSACSAPRFRARMDVSESASDVAVSTTKTGSPAGEAAAEYAEGFDVDALLAGVLIFVHAAVEPLLILVLKLSEGHVPACCHGVFPQN